jgi:hypothetical protein
MTWTPLLHLQEPSQSMRILWYIPRCGVVYSNVTPLKKLAGLPNLYDVLARHAMLLPSRGAFRASVTFLYSFHAISSLSHSRVKVFVNMHVHSFPSPHAMHFSISLTWCILFCLSSMYCVRGLFYRGEVMSKRCKHTKISRKKDNARISYQQHKSTQ